MELAIPILAATQTPAQELEDSISPMALMKDCVSEEKPFHTEEHDYTWIRPLELSARTKEWVEPRSVVAE